MTIQASAPARCGIIGNPSDIYGGYVVSASIPARATCRLVLGSEGPLPDDTRLLDAAQRRLPLPEPFYVEWSTEIPRSSGISGSTALLAATVACFLAARGEASLLEDKAQTAELVRDIERNDAQIVCGYQDAVMIVRGGVHGMDFAGKHPVTPGPAARVKDLTGPLPFLLITTGVERLSGSVHGPMAQRWLDGEKAVVEGMERITELGLGGERLYLNRDWEGLAGAMNENQRIIHALGGSGEAIDQLISECQEGGALATKLAGAGLGGTVIALTHDADGLEAFLRARGRTRFLRPAPVEGLRLEG